MSRFDMPLLHALCPARFVRVLGDAGSELSGVRSFTRMPQLRKAIAANRNIGNLHLTTKVPPARANEPEASHQEGQSADARPELYTSFVYRSGAIFAQGIHKIRTMEPARSTHSPLPGRPCA